MTSTRRFQCADLFHFNAVNFDKFTETVSGPPSRCRCSSRLWCRLGAARGLFRPARPQSSACCAVWGGLLPAVPGDLARVLPHLHRARWQRDGLHLRQGGGAGARLARPRHGRHRGAGEQARARLPYQAPPCAAGPGAQLWAARSQLPRAQAPGPGRQADGHAGGGHRQAAPGLLCGPVCAIGERRGHRHVRERAPTASWPGLGATVVCLQSSRCSSSPQARAAVRRWATSCTDECWATTRARRTPLTCARPPCTT